MSSSKPGISRVVVAVDIFNVMHRGWDGKPLSYDHLKGALRSLEAWLLRRGLTADLRMVSDPHLLRKAHPQQVSKFESCIASGEIALVDDGQEADPTVLAIARRTNGLVVSDDRYKKWYRRGHEWLMFEPCRGVMPAKKPRGPWVWSWLDYGEKIPWYYGYRDYAAGRVINLAYLREVEEVTGYDFCDSRWPNDGGPVGFHHMARALDVERVKKVRERAYALGIPNSLSTFLTDAQVRRIWGDLDPRGRRPLPWRNAA